MAQGADFDPGAGSNANRRRSGELAAFMVIRAEGGRKFVGGLREPRWPGQELAQASGGAWTIEEFMAYVRKRYDTAMGGAELNDAHGVSRSRPNFPMHGTVEIDALGFS